MSKGKSFTIKAAKEQEAMDWYTEHKGGEVITTPTEGKFHRFDNWVNSGATEYMAEVKVRSHYTSAQIKKYGGAFVEFTKVEGIRQYRSDNKQDNEVLYYCFFKDCLEIYKLSMDPTDYPWELKFLQKDDYSKQNIYKWIACLTENELVETIKYK